MTSATKAPVAPSARYEGFDYARGIAVLVMVCIHVLDKTGSVEATDSLLGTFINGASNLLTAPVFIFLMGVNRVFSRKTSTIYHVKRGLWLIALGFVLNILRGVIPVFLGTHLGWINDGTQALPHLWEIDILAFAGLAYIAISLILAASRSWIVPLVLAVGTAVIYSYLPYVQCSTKGLHYVVNLFFTSEKYSYFPFFPWSIFAFAGLSFGLVLNRMADKGRFSGRVAPWGWPWWPCALIPSGITLILHSRIGLPVLSRTAETFRGCTS